MADATGTDLADRIRAAVDDRAAPLTLEEVVARAGRGTDASGPDRAAGEGAGVPGLGGVASGDGAGSVDVDRPGRSAAGAGDRAPANGASQGVARSDRDPSAAGVVPEHRAGEAEAFDRAEADAGGQAAAPADDDEDGRGTVVDLRPDSEVGTPVGPRRRRPRRRLVVLIAAVVALVLAVAGVLVARPDDDPLRTVVEPGPGPPPSSATGAGPAGTDLGHGWRRHATWEGLRPDADGEVRHAYAAVATDRSVVVWGGTTEGGPALDDGAALDLATGGWRPLPRSPLGPRAGQVAVWTGREVVVWGGATPAEGRADTEALVDGAAYDPATDTWRRIAASPLPAGTGYEATWTGSEVVVAGGVGTEVSGLSDAGQRPVVRHNAAAAYDPAADRWRTLPDLPVDLSFVNAVAWTGDEVVVAGGQSFDDQQFQNLRGPMKVATLRPGADAWSVGPDGPPTQSAAAGWVGERLLAVTYQPRLDGAWTWQPGGEWRRDEGYPLTQGGECTPAVVAVAGGAVAEVCGGLARYEGPSGGWSLLDPPADVQGEPATWVTVGDRAVRLGYDGSVLSWSPP